MSEYQYYEFQTVDDRLSEKEIQELRAYSTRARITPTSFINEYHFGDLGWLMGVETGELEESEIEPPVPPNLDDLSGQQANLADFFRLDPDLGRNSPRTKVEVADSLSFLRI